MMAAHYYLLNYGFALPYEDALRSNPVEELSEEGFIGELHMKKTDVHFLCDLLRNESQCKSNCKCNISLEEKVLLSLNTLGSGSFRNSVKDKLNVLHLPSVNA